VLTALAKKKQSTTVPSRDEPGLPANPTAWHTLSIDQAFERLQAAAEQGRTPAEAFTVLGDPTEAALIVVAERLGMSLASLTADFPRISEIPFGSTSKRMVTVHRGSQGPATAFVKGAPATMFKASSSQSRSAFTDRLFTNGWLCRR